MSSADLQTVEEVFQAALDLPPEQRAAYLGEVCAGDAEMRSEVEALVLAYERSDDFIERPAMEIDAAIVASSLSGTLLGQTISHYRIIERLGEGGMGEVYLAEDTKLGRRIALKLLPARFTIDAERVHRFEQEARAASALNHPNIVTIHEIGQLDSSHFIATEFIEGVTLREHLGAGRLEVGEALAVATQVASALTAAHAAGIMHRDIKPENIMLRSDGYVKVLDFGLAKLTLSRTSSVDTEVQTKTPIKTDPGILMGTVNYMSPEQSSGQAVDSRTDIWSLGVLLYEMLAGSKPFKGETPSHVIVSILEKKPLPLADYSAEVPAELARIVGKALNKNRDERYQTARELHLDLQNLKQDREVEARLGRPIHPSEGKPETATRRRAAAAAGDRRPGSITGETGVAQPTSSGQYLVSQIKRHRRSFAAIGVIALVAALALSYTYFFRRRSINRGSINSGSINSIAVMPFANESGDPKLEYLSDGLAGDLIESLEKVPGLEVKPRSTVVHYKGPSSDTRRIGRELNVDAVLSAHLTGTGENLTLEVELVDSRNGNILWQRPYGRVLSGLAVLQSELRRDLVSKLSVPITDKTQEKLAKHDTENADAKESYLRGVHQARQITEKDIKNAIDLFSQAIQKDPEYARAYAAMANAHRSLTLCCDGQPSELLQAKLAAQKAVDLDPELAEGHGALAAVIWLYDWKWAEAEKEFQRALELDPNSSVSHFQYGDFLGFMGRKDEAAVQKGRALELEPYEPFFASRVGSSTDPDKGLKQILYAIDLDPNYWFSHVMAAFIYSQRKEYEKAIAEYQLAKKLSPDQTWSDANLSRIYVTAGKPEKARAILDEMLLRSKKGIFVPPYHIAMVYHNVGDKEQALYWLQKAYDIHDSKMTFLKTGNWKNVEDDPRFQDIFRRVGFPAVSDKVAPTQRKSAPTIWSAEYIVTGIRTHKIAAALIAGGIIVGIVAAFFYLKKSRRSLVGSK